MFDPYATPSIVTFTNEQSRDARNDTCSLLMLGDSASRLTRTPSWIVRPRPPVILNGLSHRYVKPPRSATEPGGSDCNHVLSSAETSCPADGSTGHDVGATVTRRPYCHWCRAG